MMICVLPQKNPSLSKSFLSQNTLFYSFNDGIKLYLEGTNTLIHLVLLFDVGSKPGKSKLERQRGVLGNCRYVTHAVKRS